MRRQWSGERMIRAGLALSLCGGAAIAQAAGAQIQVSNSKGEPLEHAVVYVVATAELNVPQAPANALIDQVDKEFIPYVTAVQAGTAIGFPNNDNIRHQVYSFSSTKPFELPLYKGNPHRPVLFDKPGIVALGCNIHDWMSSYVFVSETPWFAVTDSRGQAVLHDLPKGALQLEVWHPTLRGEPSATRQSLAGNSVQFRIAQKPLLRPFRAPTAGSAGY